MGKTFGSYPCSCAGDARTAILTSPKNPSPHPQKRLATESSDGHAKLLGIDAKPFGIDTKLLGIDAKRLGLDAKLLGLDAKRLGLDAKSLGVAAAPGGSLDPYHDRWRRVHTPQNAPGRPGG